MPSTMPYPREPGTGRPPTDTGVRTRLDDGGLSTVPGKLLSGFKWVFGDLDPGELAKLWGILRRRRTTGPLLLIEDPGELVAENVYYGTFIDLEAYERRDQSKWAPPLTSRASHADQSQRHLVLICSAFGSLMFTPVAQRQNRCRG